MNLYRLKLWPRSAWRTPWQADTLFGMLCATLAHRAGSEVLHRVILKPALAGEPPFVLSDAFPGDLLPIPQALRLRDWPTESRKIVKKARWMTPDAFQTAQSGGDITEDELLPDQAWKLLDRLHVTLDRTSDTSREGALHMEQDQFLNAPILGQNPNRMEQEQRSLYVYIRVQEGVEELILGLFALLAQEGFGADRSLGLGQFVAGQSLESCDWLGGASRAIDGCVCLSTFQPAAHDPTDGCWEFLTKYGKIGPDFGLKNQDVFKRPLVMLRPGACFVRDCSPVFLGRAIPMREFLDAPTYTELEAQGNHLIHAAFGLTVPYYMGKSNQ